MAALKKKIPQMLIFPQPHRICLFISTFSWQITVWFQLLTAGKNSIFATLFYHHIFIPGQRVPIELQGLGETNKGTKADGYKSWQTFIYSAWVIPD